MNLFKTGKIKGDVSLPSGSLRVPLLVEIAFKNLFYKKLRTTLTVMGVVIGIGAVVFLLAFGFGLRNVVTDQVVDSNSIRTIDVAPAKANLVTLNSDNLHRIERTSGVASVAPVYYYAGKVNYANATTESVIYGSNQKYIDLISFKRVAGSLPSFGSDTKPVFVNTAYTQAVGIKNPQDILGKNITITMSLQSLGAKKSIVHVGRVDGVVESGSGAEIYLNEKVFAAAGIDTASQLKVLVNDKKDVPSVQKKIETLGFLSTSPLQTLEQINQIFGFLNLLFLGFGGIGLIIAILGMFNTLTISLLERTKEIGLMIALGARSKDVKRLFMVEAIGLSLIGGLLGVILAFILSKVVDVVLNGLAHSRGVTEGFTVFTFYWWLILIIMAFSALLGLIVVYLPAKRASRINPIDALKT